MKSKFAAALLSISTLTTPTTAQENAQTYSYIGADLSACFNGDMIQARLQMETTFTASPLTATELLEIPTQTNELRKTLNSAFQEQMLQAKTNIETITTMEEFIQDTAPELLKQHFNQIDQNATNVSTNLKWTNKRWILDGCALNV